MARMETDSRGTQTWSRYASSSQITQKAAFPEKARSVALRALELDDPVLIRTGLQVLAVVGREDDLPTIVKLREHTDQGVAKDARCCLFEHGVRKSAANG
jgi:hypothetical protein